MTILKRNPIIHFKGSSTFLGDYQITDIALSKYDVSRAKFGSTEVLNSDGSSFNVKDYQYDLGNGKVGMRFIPVNDYGQIKGGDGSSVWASQLVDDYLRQQMDLKAGDPLYAFIYFFHPELNQGTVAELASTDKVEMGITHFGAYYGLGVTSNSPPLYHHSKWGVEGEENTNYGYPANVMMISMDQVDQATLNKNFLLVDKFLNYGVRFPKDYKESKFRQVDINTCLMFYRDWINEESYLKTDPTWFTYCAAHKTLVTTVALNLPHNLQSFQKVYGTEEGAKFFNTFCKNYYELTGYEFTEKEHTNFQPLWEKEGLLPQQIKPFSLAEYQAYDKARREGLLATFTGFKPCSPTQATAWGPQYTADIVFDFVQAYADFIDAGAVAGCAVIAAFGPKVESRMGISSVEYLEVALPISERLIYADAMTKAALEPVPYCEDSKYYQETMLALYVAYGGKEENFLLSIQNLPDLTRFKGSLNEFIKYLENQTSAVPEVLAWWSMARVRESWNTLISRPVCTAEEANNWLFDAIETDFDKARDVLVTQKDRVQFNAPPAIIHMIGIGMFAKNPRVKLKTLCTVMDHTELEPKITTDY